MDNRAALIQAEAENAGLTVTSRGRRFLEFALPDGRTRHVATIEPLHLRDSETEIDTGWVADTGAWQWKIAAADYQAHARSVFNVGSLYEWRKGDQWIVVDPQSINWVNQDNSRQQIAIKQVVTGQASDCTLFFPAAYGAGRHFSYTAHPRRLIKHITIDSLGNLPTPTVTGTIWFEAEFTIVNSSGVELYLDGAAWARKNKQSVYTSNRIEFRNEGGEALWYADAPSATDANGETVSAQYEVQAQGGVYFIRVRVPREWLLTAAYPVVIDPTFTDGFEGDVSTYKDAYISSGAAEANYGSRAELHTRTGTYKSLVEFDVSAIPAGSTCDSAALYFYKYTNDATDVAITGTINPIAVGNAAWVEGANANPASAGDSCWEALAADGAGGVTTAWAGSAGLSTIITDYEADAIGTWEFNRNHNAGTEYVIALTAARVAGWFSTPNTNYGLLVTATDCGTTNGQAMCSSDHATTGYRPKLVVVYTAGGGTDDLTATAITAGTPVVEAPALGQIHDLSATAITAGVPVVDSPAIGQKHALIATAVTAGTPAVDSPALGQVHALTATAITAGVPIVDSPVIGQVHALIATAITAGVPVVDSPAISEVNALTATAITAGVPVVDSPAIGQEHNLTATAITTGIPIVDSPVIGQEHNLIATAITAGVPTVGSPSISEDDVLTADDILAGTPVVDSPAIGQIHALTAVSITTGAPIVDSPVFGQIHALIATDVFAGVPTVGSPQLDHDALTATDVTTTPVVDSPALGQIHILIATALYAGVPTIESPVLTAGTTNGLAVADVLFEGTAVASVSLA